MTASKKLTQRQLGDNYARQIADSGIDPLTDLLIRQVDLAQNGPPEGQSDGSIGDVHWTKLHTIVVKARELFWACEDWKAFVEALKKEEAAVRRLPKPR